MSEPGLMWEIPTWYRDRLLKRKACMTVAPFVYEQDFLTNQEYWFPANTARLEL